MKCPAGCCLLFPFSFFSHLVSCQLSALFDFLGKASSVVKATSPEVCQHCKSPLWSETGSSNCTTCTSGYFKHDGDCLVCPVGAACQYNSTVKTIRVNPGYWRSSQLTQIVHKCPYGLHGCGGGFGYAKTEPHDWDSSLYCNRGYQGPLCAVCAPQSHYFNSDKQACVRCQGPGDLLRASPSLVFTCLLLFLSLVAVAACFVGAGRLREKAERSVQFDNLKRYMEKQYPGKPPEVRNDGSVVFVSREDAPTKQETTITKFVESNIFSTTSTMITKTVHKSKSTTITRITLVPSNKLKVFASFLRKLQVQLKALTSFTQSTLVCST